MVILEVRKGLIMEELNMIVQLLGEDNEKRLKDGITDLLLRQVEKDLEDKYEYDYILAFENIYEEAKRTIEKEFKEKIIEKYRERMDIELDRIFNK